MVRFRSIQSMLQARDAKVFQLLLADLGVSRLPAYRGLFESSRRLSDFGPPMASLAPPMNKQIQDSPIQ
jgi:hypothetical protein